MLWMNILYMRTNGLLLAQFLSILYCGLEAKVWRSTTIMTNPVNTSETSAICCGIQMLYCKQKY